MNKDVTNLNEEGSKELKLVNGLKAKQALAKTKQVEEQDNTNGQVLMKIEKDI